MKKLLEDIDGLKFGLELAQDKLRRRLMASGVSNEVQARILVALDSGITTYNDIYLQQKPLLQILYFLYKFYKLASTYLV